MVTHRGRLALTAAVLALAACTPAHTATPAATPGSGQPAASTSPSQPTPSGPWQIGYARRDLTPGALNPAVTQDTIRHTICVPGWTGTVRPPVSYTNRLKTAGIVAYGYADTDPTHYEEDHDVPLDLGGSPSDPHNLWPQPRTGPLTASTKDAMETQLGGSRGAVCRGQMTLAAAQDLIRTTWSR